MNGITFTDIKNIGACAMTRQVSPSQVHVTNCLLAQLNDDYNGKDLTNYEKVLRECRTKGWYPYVGEDNRLVHIMTKHKLDLGNEIDNPIPKLFINNRQVPEEDATLPLFSFAAKLTRKIFNMQDKDFIRANDFKYGIIGRLCLLPGIDMEAVARVLNMEYHEFIDTLAFSNKTSIQFAKEINKNINIQMRNYLK